MSTKTLLFLLMVILVGGGEKAKKETPAPFVTHAVHNICMNVWAVKTWEKLPINEEVAPGPRDQHEDHYWGTEYLSGAYFPPPVIDSSEEAKLGNEYQFKDSVTAMRIYHDFCYRRDRPRQIADSIFKCKHTYQ